LKFARLKYVEGRERDLSVCPLFELRSAEILLLHLTLSKQSWNHKQAGENDASLSSPPSFP